MSRERIDRIRAVISPTDLIAGVKPGNGNTCPICHKPTLAVWQYQVKCWRSSCTLNQAQDIFGIYSLINGTSFAESLKQLEAQSGISIVDSISQRSRLLEKCLDVFVYSLWNPDGKEALDYLYRRGFSKETVEAERIGYAPSAYCLRNFDLAIEDLQREGLIDSHNREYFSHRIIFPIRNKRGELVHLTGRYLGAVPKDESGDDKLPRYKDTKPSEAGNSKDYLAFEHELELYRKSNSLLVLAEGYPDALSLRQKGIPAVGLLGLEKLKSHAHKLKDFKTVLCVFDNDRFAADHPNYPFEYKSWRRIIPQLIELQLELPQIEFKLWRVPEQQGVKDINEWILAIKPSSKEILGQFSKASGLIEHLIERWGCDLNKHACLLKLLKVTDQSPELLAPYIPPELSPIDYAMQILP